MRSFLKVIMVFALLTSALLGLSGCEQIKSMIAPPPKIKHVPISAKVAAPGAQVTPALKNVPANVPLWPGAGVEKASTTKSSNGDSWSATLTTTDGYQDVLAGTAKGFQDAGWTVSSANISSSEASSSILTVSSTGAEGLVTVIERPNGVTGIGYLITGTK